MKTIIITIFCSGCSYPNDIVDVSRCQSRTGGLAIQVSTDSSHNHTQFLHQFSIAAKSYFGIRVPIEKDCDGSKLIDELPLLDPSREIVVSWNLAAICFENNGGPLEKQKEWKRNFVWYQSLHWLKLCMKFGEVKRTMSWARDISYIYITRDATTPGHEKSNIDILHPLVWSFSRLNGHIEPLEFAHNVWHR